MNREQRSALKVLLLDRANSEVKALQANHEKKAKRSEREAGKLKREIYLRGLTTGRWRRSSVNKRVCVSRDTSWKKGRCVGLRALRAEVVIALTADEDKKLKWLERAAERKTVDVEAAVNVIMAEVTLWDASQAAGKIDRLVERLLSRVKVQLR